MSMETLGFTSADEDGGIIFKPGKNDVLFGRGGAINSHEGNITFRRVVNEQKDAYFKASKTEKPKIAIKVVQIIRALSPPGRFLAPISETDKNCTKNSSILWHDVGFKKARAKASQCLRERERYEHKVKMLESLKQTHNQTLDPNAFTHSISRNGTHRHRDHSSLDIPDSLIYSSMMVDLSPITNRRTNLAPTTTTDYYMPKLQCYSSHETPISQMPGQSYSDHTNEMFGNHKDPGHVSSCSSWIGSFCSLESHLIDTSMSFSSHEIDPQKCCDSRKEALPSYVRSSSSMMSDITYQSEYEY